VGYAKTKLHKYYYVIRDNTGSVRIVTGEELDRLASSLEYTVLEVAYSMPSAERYASIYKKL